MKRFLVRTAVCEGSGHSGWRAPGQISSADCAGQIINWSCVARLVPITNAHNQHIRPHLTERQSMARVTVEDCIDKVDNRFDLVLLAAHRARMISSGSQLTVDRDNDKNPVVSLREIADSTISPEDLREELVHSLQKFVEVDEPEPDTVPLIGSAGASVDADDRRRRHRGRRRADDRGGTPEGSRRPGASGRAARRGRIDRLALYRRHPARPDLPKGPDICPGLCFS